jgi:predicted Zn finger-like uncharacterized protein
MTTTTQCPVCGTRFKATQAQLEAYRGMVRCGHCHAAFNAIENRTSAEPSPQLDLPIVHDEETPRAPLAPPKPAAPASPARPAHTPQIAAQAAAEDEDEDDENEEEAPGPPRTWPWTAGAVLLGLLAVGQLTYLFRVELASRLPGLKPALVAACAKLHCTVPLPRDIDLMAIESSNLEADPAQPGVITISVTLHNQAPYAQAYPNLELTLTDYNDMPVGRRIFRPDEYLKDQTDVARGLAGGRDNSIRLAIDASSLKAAGYRLYLSY